MSDYISHYINTNLRRAVVVKIGSREDGGDHTDRPEEIENSHYDTEAAEDDYTVVR